MSFGKAFVDCFGGFSRFLAAKFEARKEKASGIFSVDYQIFNLILTGKLQRREDDRGGRERELKLALKKDTWILYG